jgi:hypothetical protein
MIPSLAKSMFDYYAFSLEVFMIMVAVFLACIMFSTALFSSVLLSSVHSLSHIFIHLTIMIIACNIHPCSYFNIGQPCFTLSQVSKSASSFF